MANSQFRRQPYTPDRIFRRANRTDSHLGLMAMLSEAFPEAKRSDIKGWLKHGQVRLRGRITSQFDEPVAPGEEVEVNVTRSFPVLNHPRLHIVYEDDDIIVVNKGYGVLSVGTGSSKKETTAYDILKKYVKEQNPANKIFVVHRLDRATSGLMMFAKSMEAQEAMQHNWNNMVLARDYVAVVEGVMEEDSGVIRSNLEETSQFEVYSTHVAGAGRQAVTRYKVLARGQGRTLVQFTLDTGRKNQIRVHAHDLGHPIIGDRKYGAKSSPIGRIALHARTLRFAHPITRQDMNFQLPVPARFMTAMGKG